MDTAVNAKNIASAIPTIRNFLIIIAFLMKGMKWLNTVNVYKLSRFVVLMFSLLMAESARFFLSFIGKFLDSFD